MKSSEPRHATSTMCGLMFDLWEPRGDHENEALIRSRFPGEQLRVSTNHFEPGADFSGTSRRGMLFVAAGRAQFSSEHGDALLTSGMLMHFPGGRYGLKVLGDERCTIVKVWNVGEQLQTAK